MLDPGYPVNGYPSHWFAGLFGALFLAAIFLLLLGNGNFVIAAVYLAALSFIFIRSFKCKVLFYKARFGTDGITIHRIFRRTMQVPYNMVNDIRVATNPGIMGDLLVLRFMDDMNNERRIGIGIVSTPWANKLIELIRSRK